MGTQIDKMSDEDIANFDLSKLDEIAPVDESAEESVKDEAQEAPTQQPEPSDEQPVDDSTQQEVTETPAPDNGTGEPSNVEIADDSEISENTDKFDIAAAENFYKSLVGTPYKVKGVDVTIDNADDARKLIQRGFGVTRRMQELKPKLKLMATLEANGLLDGDKLNHLIDLSKGDTEAVKRLITDNNINVMDLNGTGENYTPVDHTINDTEFQLQETIHEIQSSPKYSDTLNEIKNMDDGSKNYISSTPESLKMLIAHQENGSFDQIKNIVVAEQAKGHYENLNFMEAYNTVWGVISDQLARSSSGNEATNSNGTPPPSGNTSLGSARHEQQGFATPVSGNSSQSQQGGTVSDMPVGNAAAKQAASSTTRTQGSSGNTGSLDFTKMSDDEIRAFDYNAHFGE